MQYPMANLKTKSKPVISLNKMSNIDNEYGKISQCNIIIIIIIIIILAVLGSELRALCLLGRCFAT
jgi:hypothetical protein